MFISLLNGSPQQPRRFAHFSGRLIFFHALSAQYRFLNRKKVNPESLLLVGLWFTVCAEAAQSTSPGMIDYSYFDGTGDRQRVVVIGESFGKDKTKANYCQTRTRVENTTSDWHDAIEILRAEEDQYNFKAADSSDSAEIVEARVMGGDGNYT